MVHESGESYMIFGGPGGCWGFRCVDGWRDVTAAVSMKVTVF